MMGASSSFASHLRRTGYKVGSRKMLGISLPGAGDDVAPSWLVSEATTFSKTEDQRDQRTRQRSGWGAGRGAGGGPKEDKKGEKGGGKGKKRRCRSRERSA